MYADAAAAEKDPATCLIPPILAETAEDVRDVIPLPGYRLAVRFHDGAAGLVDMAKLIMSSEETVFTPLRDPATFSQVHVAFGVVTWPGEIDLAPDVMYCAIKERSEWILSEKFDE